MRNDQCPPHRWAVALIVPLLILGCSRPTAIAQENPSAAGAPTTIAEPARVMHLPECLRLALLSQPLLHAARTKLQLAEQQQHTLDSTSVPALLCAPDLPIRRKQAALGVEIARASLQQRENDTAFMVTRL